MHMDKIEVATFRLLNGQQGVLGVLQRQHRAIGDPRNTPGQSNHNARLRMTSGVLKRHNHTSPIRLRLLRRCSQGVLFADLLLGCVHALHVVAKAVEQVDRGCYELVRVLGIVRAASW
jgi:hypothetical protein